MQSPSLLQTRRLGVSKYYLVIIQWTRPVLSFKMPQEIQSQAGANIIVLLVFWLSKCLQILQLLVRDDESQMSKCSGHHC